jgi:hypothetical protein
MKIFEYIKLIDNFGIDKKLLINGQTKSKTIFGRILTPIMIILLSIVFLIN